MSSAWVGDVLVVEAGHATTTVVVYMSSNRHTTHATRSARQLAVRRCVQATPGFTATPAVALPTPPECGGMRTPNVNTEESTLERTKPTILCSWTTQQPQKSRTAARGRTTLHRRPTVGTWLGVQRQNTGIFFGRSLRLCRRVVSSFFQAPAGFPRVLACLQKATLF